MLPANAARKNPVYVAITTMINSAAKAKVFNKSNGRLTKQRTKRTSPITSHRKNAGKAMLASSVECLNVGVITRYASVGRKANAGIIASGAPVKTSL